MDVTYPTNKVILSYSLLGGAMGGVLLGFYITFIAYPNYTNLDETILGFLFGIFFYAFFGAIVGFLPAITAGSFIAKREIYLHDKSSILKVFTIGFVVSGFLTAIITLPFLFNEISDWLKYTFVFGSIGGLSSLIVGSFVLPKEKNYAKS